MNSTAIGLLALYFGLAGWMYVRANGRFRRHAKLPMQWGLNKQPSWYASRRLALAVTPLLGGIAFIISALAIVGTPVQMNVDGSQSALTLLGSGAFSIAIYAGYIWLVGRWDRHGFGAPTDET